MDPAYADVSEKERVAAVRSLELLGTPFEERFDRICRLACRIFSTPIAGISLVAIDQVWYKAICGVDKRQIKKEASFAENVVKQKDVYVVEDALGVADFSDNPLVSAGPKVRFYAGFPIYSTGKIAVGAFFIADRMPRKLSELEIEIIKDLAAWAELEINYKVITKTSKASENAKSQEELAKINRELAESKARIDAMLENIGDGIIGVSVGGEIVYVNAQAEKMLGYKESDLLDRRFIHAITLIDEKDQEVATEKRPIRIALLSKKKVENREFFYQRADGSKFAAAITATPIVLYEQVIGGVSVFRDITKEYEIDRMKTEFISLASHQLRTPLSAMKWFSEMLMDGEVGQLNEEQKGMVVSIYQSNERMIELVNALLNISRIESGRIIIEPEPTDLRVLVEEVASELKPKIEAKKHHFALSVHSGLPMVNIDPKLVRHVYMNILSNAIKYTNEGGEIEVIISKSGNEIISRISDNGVGIPKDQQEKIFSRFFRGENVKKIATDGTGLGLYLAKAIVDSSGGKIWFESEEGKGTTFWFILPLKGSLKKEGEVTLDS